MGRDGDEDGGGCDELSQGVTGAPLTVTEEQPETTLAERRPDLFSEARAFAHASLAEATRKAHRFDWTVFEAWCNEQHVVAMPASPETAGAFLTEQARSKAVATLERYRATIGKLHRLQGHPSPFSNEYVKALMEGIRRTKGVAQHRKQPLTLELAGARGQGGSSVRDRAILLFGLATSFRGKELCSLDVEDLQWVDEGVIVNLRRSKTDQLGVGRPVGVPHVDERIELCPAHALMDWLDLLQDDRGPLFRGYCCNGEISQRRMHPATINKIVKSVAEEHHLDPTSFGAHSLRAGYVTEARKAGQDWATIMAQTGHKRVETVQRYDRGAIDPFRASKVHDVFKPKAKDRP